MFARLFLEHPRAVGESYPQHAAFALRFALTLFAAGAAALIHAVLPFAFETTASRIVARLHDRIRSRTR